MPVLPLYENPAAVDNAESDPVSPQIKVQHIISSTDLAATWLAEMLEFLVPPRGRTDQRRALVSYCNVLNLANLLVSHF